MQKYERIKGEEELEEVSILLRKLSERHRIRLGQLGNKECAKNE